MTDEYAVGAKKRDVQVALLGKIDELLQGLDRPTESEMVRDLALAYRYLTGGNQPGTASVSK